MERHLNPIPQESLRPGGRPMPIRRQYLAWQVTCAASCGRMIRGGVIRQSSTGPLLADLRCLLSGHAQKRVHTHLEQAFLRLSEAVPSGSGAQLGALRREIERLERSYV
jgi:hypothetical protein